MESNVNNYSDIIYELILKHKAEIAKQGSESSVTKYAGKYGLKKEIYEVKSNEVAKMLKKDIGKYTLVSFNNILNCGADELEYLINHLSVVLKSYLKTVNKNTKILIAALGNRHISADSLGAASIKNIIATSALKEHGVFKNLPNVYVFATSVFGLTGMESSDIINSIISQIKPDKLIVIDTLCATNYKRLGNNFQVNNAGIVPGGGIGNARQKVSKENTNLEVISVGVPLVVYAHSFLSNAINDINFTKVLNEFSGKKQVNESLLKNVVGMIKEYDFNNMILTIKDIEESVSLCGKVIGYAINKALLNLNVKEQKEILQGI